MAQNGGKREGAGRPPFAPTEKQRRTVKELIACGTRIDAIAAILGVHAVTVQKHFAHEIEFGLDEANATVAKTAFAMATSGLDGASTRWWLERRQRHTFADPSKQGEPGEGATIVNNHTVVIEGGTGIDRSKPKKPK